jgi:hypothetical protein
VAFARLAGLCGAWQSMQLLLPACSAWRLARSSWHFVQVSGPERDPAPASPCGEWHSVHFVVAWTPMGGA